MRRRPRGIAVAALLGATLAASTTEGGAQPAQDPLIARLNSLGGRQDSAATRRLADSVLLADATPAVRAEALFWRARMAEPPESGRTYLLRLVIEHPFNSRTGEALFVLANEELSTGNRGAAISRLSRIVRDFSGTPAGPDAATRLGRLLIEDGDLAGGCAAYDSALAHIPAESVERRNQLAYARRPCERLGERPAATGASAPDTARVSTSGAADGAAASPRDADSVPSRTTPGPASRTPPRPSSRSLARPTATRWSAQVAAFNDRADAEQAAAKLKTRGFDVRVTTGAPFRVRIGRYVTRAEAVSLVGKLKASGTNAILVEAERR